MSYTGEIKADREYHVRRGDVPAFVSRAWEFGYETKIRPAELPSHVFVAVTDGTPR
jgi:hypothetical protein